MKTHFLPFKPTILFVAFYFNFLCTTFGQSSGTLDPNFGIGGKLISKVFTYAESKAMAIQSDGKILVAATAIVPGSAFKCAVAARFKVDGTLDNSFGNTGFVKLPYPFQITDEEAADIAIDANGKILLAGNHLGNNTALLARFLSNGQPDNSFGTSGLYTYKNFVVKANAINADNRVLLAGFYKHNSSALDTGMVILLKSTNGTPDSTFNQTGTLKILTANSNSHFNDIITANGKLYAVGSITHSSSTAKVLLVQIALTSIFNSTVNQKEYQVDAGYNTQDTARHISIYGNSFVICGTTNSGAFPSFILFAASDGSLVTGYGSGGIVLLNSGNSAIIRAASIIPSKYTSTAIFVCGSSGLYDYFLLKYDVGTNSRTIISLPTSYRLTKVNNSMVDLAPNPNASSLDPDLYLTGSIFSIPDSSFAQLRLFKVMETGSAFFTSGAFGASGIVDTSFSYFPSAIERLLYYKNSSGTIKRLYAAGVFGQYRSCLGTIPYSLNGNVDESVDFKGRKVYCALNGNMSYGTNALTKSVESSQIYFTGSKKDNYYVAGQSFFTPITNLALATTTLKTWNKTLVHSKAIAYDSTSNTILIGGDTSGSVVSANQNIFLARYDADNGTPDYTFSFDGWQFTPLGNKANLNNLIISKGTRKPIGSGYFDNANLTSFTASLFRWNEDGSVDNSFSQDGIAQSNLSCARSEYTNLAQQADGKVVAIGYLEDLIGNQNVLISRFNADGTLDNSFGSGGEVSFDIAGGKDSATSIITLFDGRIAVSGDFFNGSNYDFFVYLFNQDGTLDNTFGNSGKQFIDFANSDDFANTMLMNDTNQLIIAGSGGNAIPTNILAAITYVSAGIQTSIIEKPELHFNIYPNPAMEKLHIDIGNLSTAELKILSTTGQLLSTQVLKGDDQIDISALSQGMYYAQLTAEGKVANIKFVKE